MDELFDICDDSDTQAAKNNGPQIGDPAPEFTAQTTNGMVKFPSDYTGKWVILFSHPSDFTPVCTTEFIAFQKRLKDFNDLNTEIIGLSVGSVSSHLAWIDAIGKMDGGIDITFPIIDDLSTDVARLYGMIHPMESDTHAVRSVFFIDPNGIIRAILSYPAVLGRNFDEILRIIQGLQIADKFKVAIPANWTPGDQVLAPAPATTAQMRKNTGGQAWFLKYQNQPKTNK